MVNAGLQINLDLNSMQVGICVLEKHQACLVTVTEGQEAIAKVAKLAFTSQLLYGVCF